MLTKTMMNSTRRMMWCSGVDAWTLETCFSPKIDNNDLTFISRLEKVFSGLPKLISWKIQQLRCKYSNWYALVYLSFSMFLNANIDIHIRKKRYLSIWIEFLISIRSSFDRMLWNIQFGSPRFISKIIVSTFHFTKKADCFCKCRREKYKYCENQYEFLVCLKRARTGKMVCVRTKYVFLNL